MRVVARVIHPSPISLPVLLRDADDLPILECAVSEEADVIITGDKDLLALNPFNNIPIITAADALGRLDRS